MPRRHEGGQELLQVAHPPDPGIGLGLATQRDGGGPGAGLGLGVGGWGGGALRMSWARPGLRKRCSRAEMSGTRQRAGPQHQAKECSSWSQLSQPARQERGRAPGPGRPPTPRLTRQRTRRHCLAAPWGAAAHTCGRRVGSRLECAYKNRQASLPAALAQGCSSTLAPLSSGPAAPDPPTSRLPAHRACWHAGMPHPHHATHHLPRHRLTACCPSPAAGC